MDAPSSQSNEASSLFVEDGPDIVPTVNSRGPWSPDALHGGPVAALVARAAESVPGDEELQLVRITLELLRPVPLKPLHVTSALIRPGRRVQLIETVVESGGVEVAWSRALRIRRSGEEQRAQPTVPEDAAPDPPERGISHPSVVDGYRAFHNEGMEIVFVGGVFNQPGPATGWFRLRGPVVLGEVPSPWQRAAAAADFGNGISAELEFGSGLFINPDLTVSLHRPPVGEWVCLDARTRFGTPGIGTAESELWDVEGRIGRAVQNLVVEVPT